MPGLTLLVILAGILSRGDPNNALECLNKMGAIGESNGRTGVLNGSALAEQTTGLANPVVDKVRLNAEAGHISKQMA